MMKTPLKDSSKIFLSVLKIAITVTKEEFTASTLSLDCCLLPALPDIIFWWCLGKKNCLSVIALPMSLLYHQCHIICVSQEHKTIVKCYGNVVIG